MPESFLVVVLCIAGAAFFFGSQRYLKKKVAEADKVQEYKQKKAVIGGVLYPIYGVLLIGMVLFYWNSMPVENRGFAYAFIVFGIALILYGVYKMRRGAID